MHTDCCHAGPLCELPYNSSLLLVRVAPGGGEEGAHIGRIVAHVSQGA